MKILKYTLLIVGLFLVSRIIAQPDAPQNLTANSVRFEFQGYSKIVVKLDWDEVKDSEGDSVPIYNIYRKDGEISNSNEFVSLGQVLWRNSFNDNHVIVGNTYTYYVTAEKDGESAPSNQAEVTVSGDPIVGGTASISGNVIDEVSTLPLSDIYVSLISVSNLTVNTVRTDINGNYTVEVFPGEYVVYFRADQDYFPEFYDNVRHVWEADIFTLEDNVAWPDPINAALTPMGMSGKMFNLSGNVSDNTGNPVDAVIKVMAMGLNNVPMRHRNVSTEANGSFSIPIPEGSEVVVYAHPIENNLFGEFFDNSYSLANASRILMDQDISEVNFSLDEKTEGTASISGSAFNSENEPIEAMIIAIRLGVDRFHRESSLRAFVDDEGNFSFNDLIKGDYILFGVPDEGYLPTFYKEDGSSTSRWRDADILTLDDNTDLSGINFNFSVIPEIPENGFAEIGGTVLDINNHPVGNAYIYVYDQDRNIVSYSFTNENGEYTATGLTPGIYSVGCDNYALTSEESSNVYAGLNEQATADFTLNPDTPVSVENELNPTFYKLEQNYPNPFNPSTIINFSIPEKSFITLKIYNVLGSEIKTLVKEELSPGMFKVNFDASDLPSGLYIYELSSNKFTQSRKMMLLK